MLLAVDQASGPLAAPPMDGAHPQASEDLVVREVSLGARDMADWDAFAEHCGASIRSTRAFLTALRLKNFGRMRLRLFEIHVADGARDRKVGQCAVAVTARRPSLFVDALQLSPADARLGRRR